MRKNGQNLLPRLRCQVCAAVMIISATIQSSDPLTFLHHLALAPSTKSIEITAILPSSVKCLFPAVLNSMPLLLLLGRLFHLDVYLFAVPLQLVSPHCAVSEVIFGPGLFRLLSYELCLNRPVARGCHSFTASHFFGKRALVVSCREADGLRSVFHLFLNLLPHPLPELCFSFFIRGIHPAYPRRFL